MTAFEAGWEGGYDFAFKEVAEEECIKLIKNFKEKDNIKNL